MQALILCGGRGERLMPLTACRPAGLLRITGDTVLNYALKNLKKANFKKVTLALGYLEGMILSEYETADFDGMKLSFISTENIGTAGAVAQAFDNDDMLIVEANALYNFDLNKIMSFHTINKSVCTIVTKRLSELSDHVCFSCDDDGKITSMSLEPAKDNLNCINAFTGMYILSKKAFQDYNFVVGSDFIKDIIPQMLGNDKLLCYNENGYFKKITDAHGFLNAQHDMLSGITGLSINAKNNNERIYSESSQNFNGVAIIPPVFIGRNVSIESGTVIEPYSVIDNNAVIGQRARISESYVGENAVVSSRCELIKTVLCNGGCIKKSVSCGEYSVIGEKAVIGESSVIEDNIKIWAGKIVIPDSVISRNVIISSGKSMLFDDDGEYNFAPSSNAPVDFAKMGMAVGTAFDKGDVVIVGCSEDESALVLLQSLISGLLSVGINVFDLGKCSAQQAMYISSLFSAQACCYVSATYGEKIRITDRGGLLLKRTVEKKIEQVFNSTVFRTLDCYNYGKRYEFHGAKALYESFLERKLPEKLIGVLPQIRCSSRNTACLADALLHDRNDINGERIIFHISSDGSACSAYSEQTGYVFHERLIMLAMKYLFQKGLSVSVPFTFPSIAEDIAKSENGKLLRYYNSSDNTNDNNARSVAMEVENLFVRDGLALAFLICAYLSDNKVSFADAIAQIPKFSTIQRYISYKGNNSDLIATFSDGTNVGNEGIVYKKHQSRAVIRPMKKGNGLMIFAESFKSELASSICDEIQETLKKHDF
ncbi:MAG: sugar phosphate nucleotidyltransferase [Ruminococcus sp.]|nr:sugar phosphate nucleotidyltransferase [Ruminococcus sp.]